MITLKRISAAAGIGAALALSLAAPAAAGGPHGYYADDVQTVIGNDQFCNVNAHVVIIYDSCNGNGNKDSRWAVDDD